jgi:tetratricopeptide (TPR) repeat protein
MLWPILTVVVSGCSSLLIVNSNPPAAQVSVIQWVGDSPLKPVVVGNTPVRIKVSELVENLKVDPGSGEYFELLVEKKGFTTQKLLVPATRMGHFQTQVFARLELLGPEAKEENKTDLANKLIQHLFNSQQFAQKSDFERALAEIDQALGTDAKFSRALSMKGTIYFLQGNLPESLKWYEKAIEVDPGYADAIKMISKIHAKLKDQRIPSSR